MSTYFMRQVAPMFEKPQERQKAAEGGEATAAEGGSAAGAAAGSSHATTDPQPIIIDDDGLRVGAGDVTEDDGEATESDWDKAPESSTDTDGQAELPLNSALQEQVSAFVAKDKATAAKKKRTVWTDSERLMVLDIWRDKGKSMRGTIKHLQR
eukprot:2281249-Rhodomonas_salina.1